MTKTKRPKIIGDPKTGYLAITEPCDYCGGKLIYKELPVDKQLIVGNQTIIGVHISDSLLSPIIEKKVCPECFVKVFDKVLGKPHGKKT